MTPAVEMAVVVPLETAPPLKSTSATNGETAELPQAILMRPVVAGSVVTLIWLLCVPVPNESTAATVKV